MSTTKIIALVIATPILSFIAWRVYLLIRLRTTIAPTAAYWTAQQKLTPQKGDFVYVALGDSAAQGIGASSYDKTYVALLANQITKTTGRPVHVINLSKNGAKVADVVRDQLPVLSTLKPDLVTLDIGANDAVRRTPVKNFQHDFILILNALPADRSVVSDLPFFGSKPTKDNLEPWNVFVQEQISDHRIRMAPLASVTGRTEHNWNVYAADFFHPSDIGYRNWYDAFWPEVEKVLAETKAPTT